MGSQVNDIHQNAIVTYMNDPGTTTSNFTPAMTIYWVWEALLELWREMVNQEFGYFSVREQTLAITSGTPTYALPNASNTSASTSTQIARISRVFLRQGTAAPFTYLWVKSTFPTERYYAKMSTSLYPITSTVVSGAAGFTWSSGVGSLDSNGNPTLNLELSPTPQINGMLVLDGWRYPARPALITDFIDLPDHMHPILVLMVLKRAYLRDFADTSEIEKLIKMQKDSALNFESGGVQVDGPLLVKETQ